jgi:hypothetical protein
VTSHCKIYSTSLLSLWPHARWETASEMGFIPNLLNRLST